MQQLLKLNNLEQQMGIFKHEHIKGWTDYSSEITRQAPFLPAKAWRIKLITAKWAKADEWE